MAPVDTIDLTFSSSDESPPRVLPPRSRPSGVFKRESVPSHSRSIKPERGQPVPPLRNVVSNPQQARSINPAHLEQIVNTSNIASLKKVLLDLCKTSPALSNAVARGLSRHSTFAQSVVAEHKRNKQAATAGPPTIDARRDGMRLSQQNSNFKPTNVIPLRNSPVLNRSGESGFRDNKSFLYDTRDFSPSLRAPNPAPRVKHEYAPKKEDSDSDDSPVHVPGAFPTSTQTRNPMATPLNRAPGNMSAMNSTFRTPPASQRLISARRKPIVARRQCARCESYITSEDDVCFYHAGATVEQEDGTLIWNCCNEAVGIFGCQIGTHVESERTPISLSTPKPEPESQVKICAKCSAPFQEDGSLCRHHPGTTLMWENGQGMWTCCRSPLAAGGCTTSNHVEGDWLVKRPPGSPVSPFKSHHKKFRMD